MRSDLSKVWLVLSLASSQAWAQGMGGPPGAPTGGPPTSSGAMGASAGAPASAGLSQAPMNGGSRGTGGSTMGAGAGADALFGLRPSASMIQIPLDDALIRAATQSVDLRIAREKVVQQELQVRKAWALLLPSINANANYTLNCIGADDGPFFSCQDQTIEFGSEEQLDQQKLLFSSLGEILRQVSNLEQDPTKRDELTQRADDLFATADDFEAAKDDLQPIVVQPAHVLNGSLTVSMPLFNGRALPLLQNAYTAVNAVDLAGTQARSALLYATARAYYAAYTAKKMMGAATKQLESATRHRDAVKERVSLDAAPPLTLRRAELDVIRAEQGLRSADSGYRLALGALGNLIGVESAFEVVEPPAQVPLEQERDAEELMKLAYQSRLDLRAQKLALEVADRNRLEAWLQFLPSFNLLAQGRATSNANGFVATPYTGAVIVSASIPLYDGGARYANLKETASRIREELLRVRQLETRIEGQVRGNIENLELKERALQLSREAVAVAQATVEQAKALYEVGAATPLDVSDASLALYFTEMDLFQTELDVHQARLGLAYVVGAFPGDLQASAPPISEQETEQARARLQNMSQ